MFVIHSVINTGPDQDQSKTQNQTRTSLTQTKFKTSVLHDLVSVLTADMTTLSVVFFTVGVQSSVTVLNLSCHSHSLISDVDEKQTETHREMQEHHHIQCEDWHSCSVSWRKHISISQLATRFLVLQIRCASSNSRWGELAAPANSLSRGWVTVKERVRGDPSESYKVEVSTCYLDLITESCSL
jgi:cell division protein FtsL